MHDRSGLKIPGEHHFVATYLLPVLFSFSHVVPDFVNPDGMKQLPGDILYYKNDKCILSFEVKLCKINFTKFQYTNWIHPKLNSPCPHYLIALNSSGLIICSWKNFSKMYTDKIKTLKKINDISQYKIGTYSPIYSVDQMMNDLNQLGNLDLVFDCKNSQVDAEKYLRLKLKSILVSSHVI